jgi:hypothetical protein
MTDRVVVNAQYPSFRDDQWFFRLTEDRSSFEIQAGNEWWAHAREWGYQPGERDTIYADLVKAQAAHDAQQAPKTRKRLEVDAAGIPGWFGRIRLSEDGKSVEYSPFTDAPQEPVGRGGWITMFDAPRSGPVARGLLAGRVYEDDPIAEDALPADKGTTVPAPAHDPVNHPAHYTAGAIECIDAIEAALVGETNPFVGHCRATAIKYLWRTGKKTNTAEDLRKAAWYATRAADAIEGRDAQ